MGWVRNDDDMLDHEKWRRALRSGGDGALTLWTRLTSWCSRRLTDGEVPGDMVDEVGLIGASKVRAKQLRALVDARLLAWCDPAEDTLDLRRGSVEPSTRARREGDVLVVVGYLQRNPSRDSVLTERERRAKAQQNYADRKKLTGSVSNQDPIRVRASRSGPDDVPSRPVPSRPDPSRPVPGPTREGERARGEPDPIESDGITEIPDDWVVTEALYAEASLAGVTRPVLDEDVAYWRERKSLGGEFRSVEGFFRTHFARLAKRRETELFAKTRDNPADDRQRRQADRVRMLREQELADERLALGGAA